MNLPINTETMVERTNESGMLQKICSTNERRRKPCRFTDQPATYPLQNAGGIKPMIARRLPVACSPVMFAISRIGFSLYGLRNLFSSGQEVNSATIHDAKVRICNNRRKPPDPAVGRFPNGVVYICNEILNTVSPACVHSLI